jgi:hypothetical protein
LNDPTPALCGENKGLGGKVLISEEVINEIALHNSIRLIISDYIGEGVDNCMRECVDRIIELMKEYYRELAYKDKFFDKGFDEFVRKQYKEK